MNSPNSTSKPELLFRVRDLGRNLWLNDEDTSLHCFTAYFLSFKGEVKGVDGALEDGKPQDWSDLDKTEFRMEKGKAGLHTLKAEDRFVIQQYTGKNDINGRKMFGGDLVQMRYATQPDLQDSLGIYEIYYDTRWAAFYLRVIKKNWFDGQFITEKDAKKMTIDPRCPVSPILTRPLGDFGICEVIGNIYDNPELA